MKFFVVSVIYLMCLGCVNSAPKNVMKVLYKGTKSYDDKVKNFSISPEQALIKVIEFYKKTTHQGGKVATGCIEIIVGNWYVIGLPQKTKIPLRGVYVHGVTGKVIMVETDKVIERSNKVGSIELSKQVDSLIKKER